MELSDVQLEDMAADIFKEFEPLAKSQKISLVYHAPAQKTLKVKTDVIRLREAVKNIIANAIYYTPKGYVEIEIGKRTIRHSSASKIRGLGSPSQTGGSSSRSFRGVMASSKFIRTAPALGCLSRSAWWMPSAGKSPWKAKDETKGVCSPFGFPRESRKISEQSRFYENFP